MKGERETHDTLPPEMREAQSAHCPETVAAILREMRGEGGGDVAGRMFREYAERIEAALAREAELADDEQWAPRHGKPTSPSPTAPGNAAAMRAALNIAERMASDCLLEGCGYAQTLDNCEAIASYARAALSAPARNCDRYATAKEATRAFQTMREHKVWADACLWDNRDEIGAFLDWLFATAEGGAV